MVQCVRIQRSLLLEAAKNPSKLQELDHAYSHILLYYYHCFQFIFESLLNTAYVLLCMVFVHGV